jgi:hypothetical protein
MVKEVSFVGLSLTLCGVGGYVRHQGAEVWRLIQGLDQVLTEGGLEVLSP